MTGIPLHSAADAFRRFFPDDWDDHLRAWMAAQGMTSDPPPDPTPDPAPRILPREES